MQDIYDKIRDQVERVGEHELDKTNTKSDWITYITAYASSSNPRLERGHKDLSFEDSMIRVAALAVMAIKNERIGNC